ncbi:MAG: AI-2E family transporter [Ruminococcus sp.]|nr:AI-2E family transporter [Ruminococcus sp.]
MKIQSNKKYSTIALYAGIVLAANVLLVLMLFNLDTIFGFLRKIVKVLNPVTWGIVIAFLVNPVMMKTERGLIKLSKKLSKKEDGGFKPGSTFVRVCSVAAASIVFLGIVVGLVAIVVPELIHSLMELFDNATEIADNFQNWINKMFKNNPKIAEYISKVFNEFNTDFSVVMTRIQPILENVLNGAWGFLGFLKDFSLGFIVSIYMLFSKEKLLAQLKKITFSLFKKSTCQKIMTVSAEANKVFSGFVIGKIIDSIIIGMICFIGMTIMEMPYNIMISVIIGVTNVIPFFGPFIGAIPSALFILIIEPRKTILFLVFILVLQQFDGNILGPKILGDSTGLPGFWVLISLLICGGLFGFVGMVMAVPVFALIYSFTREAVENRLRARKLPVSTEYYKKDITALYSKPSHSAPLTPEELLKLDIPTAEEVNEA